MKQTYSIYLFFAYIALNFQGRINGLVHDLAIVDDDRDLYKIETFGFVSNGLMDITVKDFSIVMGKLDKSPLRVGFFMRKATSESGAQQDLEKLIEDKKCIFDSLTPDDVMLDLSDPKLWKDSKLLHIVGDGADGLYSLIFARCSPKGTYKTNFKLHADFFNPGPNYLSAGDAALPALYLAFFFLFSGAFVVWCWVLNRPSTYGAAVHSIHYLMAVLLAIKAICLLVESIRFHYISVSGRSETWSIIYYIITTLVGAHIYIYCFSLFEAISLRYLIFYLFIYIFINVIYLHSLIF